MIDGRIAMSRSWWLLAGVLMPMAGGAEGLPVSETARTYWEACAASSGTSADRPLRARRFGSTREMSQRLLDLILAGEKTITSTSPWLYDDDLEAPPEVGDVWVVMDGDGAPAAVLRTTGVKILPMDQVTEEDSRHEGPTVRPIQAWRSVHWNFFTRVLAPRGAAPAEDMPVTLEYFEVICPDRAQ